MMDRHQLPEHPPNVQILATWVQQKQIHKIKSFLERMILRSGKYHSNDLEQAVTNLFTANPDYFMEEIYPAYNKLVRKSELKDPTEIDRHIFESTSLLPKELLVTEFWGSIKSKFFTINGLIILTTHRVVIFGPIRPTFSAFLLWKLPMASFKAIQEVKTIRMGVCSLLRAPQSFGYCFPFTSPTNVSTSHKSLKYTHSLAVPTSIGWKSKDITLSIQAKDFYSSGILNQFRRVITKNEELISLSRVINVCPSCGKKIRQDSKFCSYCGTLI